MKKEANTINELKVEVSWDDYEYDKSQEGNNKDWLLKINAAFALSILGYIKTFKSLPPIGLWFDNCKCDRAKIQEITFDGINNRVFVWLHFD